MAPLYSPSDLPGFDYERDLARVESGEELRVVYNRRIAMLFDGRFQDAIIDSAAEKVAPLQLDYVRWLFDDSADLERIEESVVDGEPLHGLCGLVLQCPRVATVEHERQ